MQKVIAVLVGLAIGGAISSIVICFLGLVWSLDPDGFAGTLYKSFMGLTLFALVVVTILVLTCVV